MEEPLKARLIGASILVLLAVVLVPELLSGPKNSTTGGAGAGGARNTRTVTIDLGGAVAEGARLQPSTDTSSAPVTTPSLPTVDSPATPPEAPDASPPDDTPPARADTPPARVTPPVPETKVAARPAEKPAATPRPEPETRPAAVEPPPVAATKNAFSVQVGAFGAEATARKLVAELKADGLPAYIAPLSRSGKTLHRVRVGPVPDRAAADKLAARLKARGLPVSVVAGG